MEDKEPTVAGNLQGVEGVADIDNVAVDTAKVGSAGIDVAAEEDGFGLASRSVADLETP